ncbi:uncharacterized protein PAC_03468 [Phialocephala subalpina]|uniref:NACHT domain-containing protein n=1 Tax=Phialocephala subalpina TaxID=576137 RepID=A0A1L7WLE4_9HELO|nr:uncharacterized protein PAC_03468 [Phialocephala subalpina]
MDPLSCLAIAGAVVQFSTLRAAKNTSDLQNFSTQFEHVLRSGTQGHGLSEDEQALQSICLECKTLAESLTTNLESLNVHEKHRVWKSLGAALSNVWSKNEILRMEEDLRKYRSAIDTRMIGLTRNAVTMMASQQSTRFNSLDLETKRIITSLTELKSSMEGDLKIQRLALSQLLNRQEAVILLADNTRTVINLNNNSSSLNPESRATVERICDDLKSREGRLRQSISSDILESLRFPLMAQRFDDVMEAHNDTFRWIFQHPHEDIEGRQWDDFVDWLETGKGLYWINGKAGSGKSTLLKLISHSPLMAQHLSTWKQTFDLYTAGFFFWSSGTKLQQSQEGMLRSLLYDILFKVTQLIPLLFPTEWAEFYLQKMRLPSSTSKLIPMRLCLFIDGLDEYSGWHSQIANLFHKAVKSPQVKVCLSSRPLFTFKESFANQPQLRLEDLTRGDIQRYVVDMLENNEIMQKRMCKEPDQMRNLVDEICQSASGVFLWVKLIVTELQRGLENHDKASQLQERLRLLPTDLEALYEHMVFKVDTIYRVEASKFYQIIMAAAEQEDDWRPTLPLTIMNLFLAEEDSDLVFKAEMGWLSKDETNTGIFETDLRLRSRCGGLLETRFGKSSLHQIQPEMPVSFIHRTVRDYLDGAGIRHILSDRTGGLSAGSFNPNIALMRAYILHLKHTEPTSTNSRLAQEFMGAFITHARRAERDLCQPNTELIDHFSITCKTWIGAAGLNEQLSSTDNALSYNENTAILAIKCGLPNYLRAQLDEDLVKADRGLLDLALCLPRLCERFVSKEIVSLLLEYGANPDEKPPAMSEKRTGNQSPWQNAITYLAIRFQEFRTEEKEQRLAMRWHGIIKLLLQHGAKANTVCAGPKEFTIEEKTEQRIAIETTTTPKKVIQALYKNYPKEQTGLLKILDSKGATMPEEDDQSRPKFNSFLSQKKKVAEKGGETEFLQSAGGNNRRDQLPDLRRAYAQSPTKRKGSSRNKFKRGLERLGEKHLS